MNQAQSRYAEWKAPADDGQTLVWPEPAQLLADTRENAARLKSANHVKIQGLTLPELRQRARAFIGHSDGAPLIASGHQTELNHPGVWVKEVLIDAVATKMGGSAFHFAVDTDAPKHLHLRWPGGSQAITDDENLNSAAWCALLSAPTPRHVEDVRSEFDEHAREWPAKPAIDGFFESLRRLALETPNLSAALTNATHELDWSFGLRNHSLLTSPLWWSEAYLIYLHDLLADAPRFVANYNAALEAYRKSNGVRTSTRPMPDLRVTPTEIEVPFWLDYLAGGLRERAFLKVGKSLTIVLKNGDGFEFTTAQDADAAAQSLASWCRQNQVRLAPRALTLTMYLRLCIADQFVHGIGGGRYDQVTDDLISRQFNFEPPRFAVTTATLYFPAAAGQRRINLRPLFQEGRRIRHGMLSKNKMSFVAEIDRMPRRSRQRRDLYFEMHRRLADESNSPAVRAWKERFREAEHESLRQKTLFDRELFYAIQPRERLAEMIQRYRSFFA